MWFHVRISQLWHAEFIWCNTAECNIWCCVIQTSKKLLLVAEGMKESTKHTMWRWWILPRSSVEIHQCSVGTCCHLEVWRFKTASSFEMLVNFYLTRWHHTPEGSIFNNHHSWAFLFMWSIFADWLERRTSEMFTLLHNINQQMYFSKLIIYVFYMLRTWGFIFRKTVVYVGIV